MNDCCTKVRNEMGGKTVFFTTEKEYTDKNNSSHNTQQQTHRTHSPNTNSKVSQSNTDCQIQKDQKTNQIIHSTSYPLRPICETFSNIKIANRTQDSSGQQSKQSRIYSRVIFRSSSTNNYSSASSTKRAGSPLPCGIPPGRTGVAVLPRAFNLLELCEYIPKALSATY
jgi:hypothetical protein